MRKLDFFRLPAPAAMPAHLGAGSLKKSNFLIFSKVLRKGADQANWEIVRILEPHANDFNDPGHNEEISTTTFHKILIIFVIFLYVCCYCITYSLYSCIL